jgi:hypothetical protein
VQKVMLGEKKPAAWSKITDYAVYMSYQLAHRQRETGNYPIVDEFNFYSSYNPKD